MCEGKGHYEMTHIWQWTSDSVHTLSGKAGMSKLSYLILTECDWTSLNIFERMYTVEFNILWQKVVQFSSESQIILSLLFSYYRKLIISYSIFPEVHCLSLRRPEVRFCLFSILQTNSLCGFYRSCFASALHCNVARFYACDWIFPSFFPFWSDSVCQPLGGNHPPHLCQHPWKICRQRWLAVFFYGYHCSDGVSLQVLLSLIRLE